MKRKAVLTVLIVFISLLQYAVPTYTVKGDKDISIYSALGSATGDNNVLYHSSGKFVYVWLDSSTKKAYAEIFGSGGLYEAQIEEALTVSTSSHEIAVVEWSATEFVIVVTGYDSSATHKISFTLCNINTYTHTEYAKESTTQVYNLNRGTYVTKALGLIYAFAQFGSGGSTPYPRIMHVYTFNGSSGATTLHAHTMDAGGTTVPWGMIQGFVGEGIYYQKAYLIIPKDADPQKPVYYEYDLDSFTLTELATHPVTARYHDDNGWQFQHYLEGGMVTSGNYIYLYHTWVYGYLSGAYRLYKFIQHRLVFNQTLQVANLTAQSELVAGISPNLGGSANRAWIHGYMDDYNDITLYYANLGESGVVCSKQELYLSNWLDYSGGASIVVGDYTHDSGELNFYGQYDSVRRDFASPFQVNIWNSIAHVYTELYMPLAEYSVGITYSPADDPLYTDTSYRFTISTTRNGIGFRSTVLVYFDGSNVVSGRTEANGVIQFTLTTSLGGYHNITVVMYESGVEVDSVSNLYLFQKEELEAPTTEALLPQSVAITTEFVPIALITLVPTGIFSKLLGFIGGVIGLNLGIIIAIGAGMLPGYVLYLMLLFDAILAVMMIKEGM